ncbi:pyridoxamine 5'-phosphate oxidase family protein [Mycolicibacterium sp. BiH015]|uniref:pyridoxamine 5'-phosphate oxidase family protein n=1 Tax=Mycolicibacterium sp. BiH015 TaxID=3018808 RepID=UPI0022E220D1|nr:pyridoxamine 5'-phosphate oxidase family protein [Mycolicibacterium sp. BiH015]MDA2893291.1 pyridoxamine 5'-phosphate oxidase family protein [Mycolicibacterium sp. BiH015]
MFTDAKSRFLDENARGRLTSIGPDDRPQIHPVNLVIKAEAGAIDVVGAGLRDSQKYRNARRDPRVTLTVDDPALPLRGSGDRAVGRGMVVHGLA